MTHETAFLRFWRALNAALVSRALPEASNGLACRQFEIGREPEAAARDVVFWAAFS